MLVSDYLHFVTQSEIKPLAVSDIGDVYSDDEVTSVQVTNRRTLISYLNQAILAVHSKFNIIQKEFILNNTVNNSTHDIPVDFLFALNAAFEDGREIPLNNERKYIVDDTDECVSVLFPAQFKALVKGTDPLGLTRISLTYVARPEKIKSESQYIDLSEVFNEPIYNYIAYKAYAAQNGGIQETNNTFFLRYNNSCNHIELMGMTNQDNLDSNIKLDERGFV